MSKDRRERLHVVIAGGGVAALETLLALRALAAGRVDITLLSAEREFLDRPATVAEAFERDEARVYAISEILERRGGGELVCDALEEVDAEHHVAVTRSGKRVAFDALVLATGALTREPLPGALTFRGRNDVPALRSLLDELVQGRARSVALALPSERIWPLPIYELALMTAAHLKERGADAVRVCLVTPEERPLALFGPAAAGAIRPMLAARRIEMAAIVAAKVCGEARVDARRWGLDSD